MTFILGISAYYHDSAAALIGDGKIIAAAQEERFTRIKHDPAFPEQAIRYCLEEAGITFGEVSHVVFYDKPLLKFERLLETYLSFAPRGFRSFLAAMPVWLKEKLFLKATTRSLFHIPLNMGSVYPNTFKAIEEAQAQDMEQFIVLSHDPSAWRGEHLFSVTRDVPGQEMVHLTGDFLTKVFEGPYRDMPQWEKEMEAFVRSKGKQVAQTYFFYTTCPKCAKFYGKNYVVAVAAIH